VPYFQQITATGGTAPYTFSRLTGSLPAGITISSSGVISGSTTAAPGLYSFTVQALDANGAPGTQPYSITVLCPDFVISPSTLTNGVVGSAYSAPLNAVGGSAPYVWSVVGGTLPDGLSLTSNGIISGTPTRAMTSSFTVEARDAFNCVSTRLYTLAVNCPAISITPATLPNAYYGSAYTQALTAASGTGPYTWSVIAGTPPAGLTLSAGGVFSGTPLVYGTASFTVRVTDAYNCSATQSYSLLVKGLSLGDLVYEDTNFNGLHDVGEPGVKDVTVELWDPGADLAIGGTGPNSDLMLRSTTTGAIGQYHFDNLQPGSYFLRLLMPSPLHIPGGNPVNADNGIDNDNNSASQPGGAGTPIFSPVIALNKGDEPVAEDGDNDTDYTVDFGLFRGMSVGNLVWQDDNDNGLRDAGEPGIDGVGIELWATGADGRIGGTDDSMLQSTATAGGGAYLFNGLPPVPVYVRIPTPPAAQPLSSSITAFNDNGIDNDDNGHQVNGGAVYSPVITLTAADEPGTGGGGYDELTVDFGFLNVTPSIYVSATQADSIQTFDASSGLYTGSLVEGFGDSLAFRQDDRRGLGRYGRDGRLILDWRSDGQDRFGNRRDLNDRQRRFCGRLDRHGPLGQEFGGVRQSRRLDCFVRHDRRIALDRPFHRQGGRAHGHRRRSRLRRAIDIAQQRGEVGRTLDYGRSSGRRRTGQRRRGEEQRFEAGEHGHVNCPPCAACGDSAAARQACSRAILPARRGPDPSGARQFPSRGWPRC
jgi:hypothetical protein